MKNANKTDLTLVVSVVAIAVLLLVMRASAQQYEYKGVYPAQAIFTNLCENCFLELPAEFLQTSLVLSVSTDKVKTLERALVSSAKSAGWALTKRGNTWSAEPVQNEGSLVYISCLTDEPVNVPKYLYTYAIRSDSIRCARRDSIARVQDSVKVFEKSRNDSLAQVRLPFGNYELRYYSFTKNFTDKLGVEFNGVIAHGNLHDKFHWFDDWKLHASEMNDTSFTYRQINVAFDSSLSVDWGTEEQTLKTTYVTSNGVVNSDYEWRKYGLIVKLEKDFEKVRISYVFRDKEQNISVLQGSAVGTLGDTLMVSGEYTTQREVTIGIPFLCRIPLLKYLVSTEQVLTDIKHFELYLVPTEPRNKNEYGRFKKNGEDGNTPSDTTSTDTTANDT